MSMLFLYWFGFLSFDNFLKFTFRIFLKFIILFIIQIKNKRLYHILASLHLKEILKFGLFVLIGGASVVIVLEWI